MTIDPEVLTRLRAAEAHMVVCRALLDVPEDDVLAEKIREMKAELDRVNRAAAEMRGFDALKFASEWYRVPEIEHFQSRQKALRIDAQDRIPEDIYSKDFAVWLTEQYKLAMMKGVQVVQDRALSTGAGRDYHHRDEYKPLVEVLLDIERRGCGLSNEHRRKIEQALADAKAKGLIE